MREISGPAYNRQSVFVGRNGIWIIVMLSYAAELACPEQIPVGIVTANDNVACHKAGGFHGLRIAVDHIDGRPSGRLRSVPQVTRRRAAVEFYEEGIIGVGRGGCFDNPLDPIEPALGHAEPANHLVGLVGQIAGADPVGDVHEAAAARRRVAGGSESAMEFAGFGLSYQAGVEIVRGQFEPVQLRAVLAQVDRDGMLPSRQILANIAGKEGVLLSRQRQ